MNGSGNEHGWRLRHRAVATPDPAVSYTRRREQLRWLVAWLDWRAYLERRERERQEQRE